MTTSADIDLDLTVAEQGYRFQGRRFVAREASAGVAAQYRNAVLKAMKMKDGDISSMEGLPDADLLLVALCLKECVPNGRGEEAEQAVPLQTVRGWPHRVQKPILEWIKDASQLNDDTEEALVKRIAADQKKLAALRAVRNGEAEKNRWGAGADTST